MLAGTLNGDGWSLLAADDILGGRPSLLAGAPAAILLARAAFCLQVWQSASPGDGCATATAGCKQSHCVGQAGVYGSPEDAA